MIVVLNYAKREARCSECGQSGVIFSAHVVAAAGSGERDTVVDRCKGCLERRVAAEERALHVKSTWPRLREVWHANRRGEASEAQRETLAKAREKQREAAIAQNASQSILTHPGARPAASLGHSARGGKKGAESLLAQERRMVT